MLEKIQRTYEKYLEKKQKRPPRVSKEFKDDQSKKDVLTGNISWKYVTAEDLELLDLGQESSKTSILFICNLLMMILMLFILVGVLVITAVVSYAGDEMEMLHEMRGYDSSIFLHNLY